jgi:ubiquinone/menaquinone biosynthesis C-methylase UbiE
VRPIPAEAAVDVPEAFDDIAASYDLMVALNPGYHRHLRSAANALVERLPAETECAQLLDVGCGSGASTRAVVEAMTAESKVRGRPFRLTAIDGSTGMLEQARRKAWPRGVRFEYRMAEDLSAASADWGLTEAVDGVFAAYLFRNVADRDKVLEATHELLAPGGSLVVQEYSVAGSRLAQLTWTLVCWTVVVPLSWLVNRRTKLYRYLWRSVLSFDSVETFAQRMQTAGFTDVEVRTVGGWQRGILHTFRGRRSPDN